ncbi:c-type cytochrome [Azoarcus olearius]|uniref:Sulfide dehydrogenase, cytochrome subunit n=1 Tax=Azoarcus sp. (strain BH72) TaxID=418699 RepID=A1K4K4_AZOSB|nr:c-type cytochrome [Azoarcus olearius]ANQ84307.1 putative sulfide dehydrogenase, cytochrome subunit [Azoarcus olearius]CAL93759.1 putative sulfide dehydrogenase, cytochrome subunit [Azoarcus olearius]
MKSRATLTALFCLGLAQSALAAAPPPGRSLAATCFNCHGSDGRSQGAIASLAGMPSDTLLATLEEFRSGARPATIMHQIVRGYTPQQLELIARYFAQLK